MAKTKTPSALTALAQTLTVTTPAPTVDYAAMFQETRDQSAVLSRDAYGATKVYAQKLIDAFGQNFWRKSSASFKLWQEERARYDATLKAKIHPNPSQAHSRLIDAADAICNPQEAKPKSKLTLSDRQKKTLIELYRSGHREENKVGLDDKESAAHLLIGKILQDVFKLKLSDVTK